MGDFCKKCREYVLLGNKHAHKCPPLWEIWDDESYGDKLQTVYAHDPGRAGQKYAKSYDTDDCDYVLTNGDTHKVKIRKFGETEWKIFELSADLTVVYYAKEAE